MEAELTSSYVSSTCSLLQGGGLFMRGLQNDNLGSTGQTLLQNVTLANNTAGFGGAVACDNCRMLVSNTSMLHNTAVRIELQGSDSKKQQKQGNFTAGVAEVMDSATITSSSSSNSSEGNTNATLQSCQGDDIQSAPAPLMAYQVRGAGGAIAANMAGNSFIVLCGSSSSSSSSSNNLLLHNHAQAVGGAFYVNYTASKNCAGPSLEELRNSTCLAGIPAANTSAAAAELITFNRVACGLTMVNVDWSNSTSNAGGDLLGWAGGDGFSMFCSSSNSSSCSSLPGNISSLVTISNGGAFSSNKSNTSNSSQLVCLVRYTARDAAACLPAAAAAGAFAQKHNNLTAAAAASSHLYIQSPDLRFELPTSLGVFNGTCLKQQQKAAKEGRAANASSCAVAGLRGATMPKVFSGGEEKRFRC
jgi:predicted outer membrane repeat protein